MPFGNRVALTGGLKRSDTFKGGLEFFKVLLPDTGYAEGSFGPVVAVGSPCDQKIVLLRP